MPNWCSSAYVIEGDAKEIKSLYKLMKRLGRMIKPSVKNGFGTTWLGCLVDALGMDWNSVHCRGEWTRLKLENGVLKFSTETAWSPCNQVLDLVCEKFPSLGYYFRAEEPGMGIYITNDEYGAYFPERYYLDICTPEEEYISEYFENLEGIFKWFEDELGQPVKSEADISDLSKKWREENNSSFCSLHEFVTVE